MRLTTSLDLIRAQGPCTSGWRQILHSANEAGLSNDDVFGLDFVLESNGEDDTMWALCAIAQVGDPQTIAAIDVFLQGLSRLIQTTFEELYAELNLTIPSIIDRVVQQVHQPQPVALDQNIHTEGLFLLIDRDFAEQSATSAKAVAQPAVWELARRQLIMLARALEYVRGGQRLLREDAAHFWTVAVGIVERAHMCTIKAHDMMATEAECRVATYKLVQELVAP